MTLVQKLLLFEPVQKLVLLLCLMLFVVQFYVLKQLSFLAILTGHLGKLIHLKYHS
jgi:hypothetical protein